MPHLGQPPWFQLPASPRLGHNSRVAVVGGGLAGCWLAYEFAQHGVRVQLYERGPSIASGASGNAVGIVKPFVTRDESRGEAFHQQAFEHLTERLSSPGLARQPHLRALGVIQLLQRAWSDRPDLEMLTAAEIADVSGLSAEALGNAAGIYFGDAGWLRPAALCEALVDAVELDCRLGIEARIGQEDGEWCINDSSEPVDHVVLACGPAIADHPKTRHLPIVAARGQIDGFDRGSQRLDKVVTGLHWCIPDGDVVYAGSTFQRDDHDCRNRGEDTEHNREQLEALTGIAPGDSTYTRAQVRATTPDRLPVVGPVCDWQHACEAWKDLRHGKPAEQFAAPRYVQGLSVLGGLGSRGIVTSALSASLLVSWLCDGDAVLQAWQAELAPHRFLVRDARRGVLQRYGG